MQPLHCDLQPLSLVTTSLSSVTILRHPFVITSLSHNPLFPLFMWSIVMWCTAMWCKISQYYLSVTRKIASQLPLINVFWFLFKNHPGHSLGGVTVLHFVETQPFCLQNCFRTTSPAYKMVGPWAIGPGHFMAYKMVVPVNCLGSLESTTILTVSPKNDQTCAFMFL